MRVSNSIAAHNSNTFFSNGDKPSRSVRWSKAEGISDTGWPSTVSGAAEASAAGDLSADPMSPATGLADGVKRRRIEERVILEGKSAWDSFVACCAGAGGEAGAGRFPLDCEGELEAWANRSRRLRNLASMAASLRS